MAAEQHAAAEGLETDFSYTPSYEDLEDLQSLEKYTKDKLIEPGQYSRDTEVGFLGSKAFYVQEEKNSATSVAGALMAEALKSSKTGKTGSCWLKKFQAFPATITALLLHGGWLNTF